MPKIVNYTPEMTARAVELYKEVVNESEDVRAQMVTRIALELDKTDRSVRSKLSREGVYIAKRPVSKVTGESPAKKIKLATDLVHLARVNVDPENVAKMNKLDIMAFIAAFENRD